MRAPIRSLLALSVCVAASACNDASRTPVYPTAPSPTTNAPSPAPTASQTIRVVSGGDGRAVTGATVTINGRPYGTDAAGLVGPDVVLNVPMAANSVDIEAPGFLKRETRIPDDGRITLWPVASDEEARAVREMVYRRGGSIDQVLDPPDTGSSFLVTLDEQPSADILEAWLAGARAFGTAFNLEYQVTTAFSYETNELTVRFNQSQGCIPIAAWGFCREASPYITFWVLPERARDVQTIRRVVASWFLGPNPLPGFMNRDAPATELTPFEMQTIRMILQRSRPTRWPDNDR